MPPTRAARTKAVAADTRLHRPLLSRVVAGTMMDVLSNDPPGGGGSGPRVAATAVSNESVAPRLVEDMIGLLLLRSRQCGVEGLEGRDESHQVVGMPVGDDLAGFEVVDCRHRTQMGRPFAHAGAECLF